MCVWISVVTLSALLSGKKIRLCWCHSSLCLIVSLFSFSCFSMFRCSLRTCRRAANTLRRDSDILQNTKDIVLLSLFNGYHSHFSSQVLSYRSWMVVNVYAPEHKGFTMISDPLYIIHINYKIKKRFQHCGTESTALLLTCKRSCAHRGPGFECSLGHVKVLSSCTLLSISSLYYLCLVTNMCLVIQLQLKLRKNDQARCQS